MAGGKTLNLVFKKILDDFPKIQENTRISILKRRLRAKLNQKRKTSNQKFNRGLETYKINFIN